MLYPHQRQAVEVAISEIHNRFKTGVGEAPNRTPFWHGASIQMRGATRAVKSVNDAAQAGTGAALPAPGRNRASIPDIGIVVVQGLPIGPIVEIGPIGFHHRVCQSPMTTPA